MVGKGNKGDQIDHVFSSLVFFFWGGGKKDTNLA